MILDYPLRSRPFYCEHLWTRISVLADGSVEPCSCALSGHDPFPFAAGGLRAIWNNEWFRRTRRYLIDRRIQSEFRVGASDAVFDCCVNCPVAPRQRFQSVREYYSILAHAAALKNPLRRLKLNNLARLQSEARACRDVISAMPAWANIDPANRCNLRCPECLVGRGDIKQPPRTMDLATFDAIMSELGPTLMFVEFYRYGEPLINRDTPAMIERAARQYGIATRLSTNFALPLGDDQLQTLIDSGLRQLVIAADDIAQEHYEQYRRGGRIEVVADNLRRLAALRNSRDSHRLRILWQALRFGFNQDRASLIERQVRAWGADRFVMLPAYISGQHPELLPLDKLRRGRKNAGCPHPILAARFEPRSPKPGEPFRLTVKLKNDLGRAIPAESGSDPHPIRIGIVLIDAAGQRVGELGRIHIDRPVAPHEEAEFSAQFTWPAVPFHAFKLDLVAEFLFWFEDQADIQAVPFKCGMTRD